MISVIDQIKNRLEILQRQAPLVAIIKPISPFRRQEPPAMDKILFPETKLSMEVKDIEPIQRTMDDVRTVEDTFKPPAVEIANKNTTSVFKRRK